MCIAGQHCDTHVISHISRVTYIQYRKETSALTNKANNAITALTLSLPSGSAGIQSDCCGRDSAWPGTGIYGYIQCTKPYKSKS